MFLMNDAEEDSCLMVNMECVVYVWWGTSKEYYYDIFIVEYLQTLVKGTFFSYGLELLHLCNKTLGENVLFDWKGTI